MKNLEIYKKIATYALIGTVGIGGVHVAGMSYTDETKIVDDDIKNEPLKTPQPTSTPQITGTPQPTSTKREVYKYPKTTYGYVIKSLKLKKDITGSIKLQTKLPKYQTVKMIEEEKNQVLVKYKENMGYINKKDIVILDKEFVTIDIDEQLLKIINASGSTVLKTHVVTGTDTNEDRKSDRGVFEIYLKDEDRYLNGPGYSTHVNYFAAYNGGEGLHDASWRSSFGGDTYMYDGSHGCINLPVDVAPKVYKKVKIGTKVIVHD